MREVARPRQVHRDARGVRSVNRLLVTHGTTGLDDRLHVRVNENLQAIGEGEERIRRGNRADGTLLRSLGHDLGGASAARTVHVGRRRVTRRARAQRVRTLNRQLARVHAVHLAHANAHRRAILDQQNRVRTHRTHRAPRELQVRQRRLVGGSAGRKRPVLRGIAGRVDIVALLDQQTTADLLELVRAASRGLHLQDAQVLLRAQHLERALLVVGGQHDLGEDRDDLASQLHAHRAVHGDHAAERRHRVAGVREAVRLGHVVRHGDAAGVRVLDDRHAGALVIVGGAQGGVAVRVVVVAHGLAVQLARVRDTRRQGLVVGPLVLEGLVDLAVHGRALMRVLAVAQRLHALERVGHEHGHARGLPVLLGGLHHVVFLGLVAQGLQELSIRGVQVGLGGLVEGLAYVLEIQLVGEPSGDRQIVGRRVREGLGGQRAALLEGEALPRHGLGHIRVTLRGGHDRDRRVILRCGAHHGRAADVNLLDTLVERRARRDRVLERVQVAHDQVKRLDTQLRDLLAVRGLTLIGQDARMNEGMQGLHATLEHLGETRHVVDRGDRHASRRNTSGRGARGDDLHAGLAQRARKVLQARLVIHRNQGTLNRAHVNGFQVVQGDGHSSSRLRAKPRRPGGRRHAGHAAAPRWSSTLASRGTSSLVQATAHVSHPRGSTASRSPNAPPLTRRPGPGFSPAPRLPRRQRPRPPPRLPARAPRPGPPAPRPGPLAPPRPRRPRLCPPSPRARKPQPRPRPRRTRNRAPPDRSTRPWQPHGTNAQHGDDATPPPPNAHAPRPGQPTQASSDESPAPPASRAAQSRARGRASPTPRAAPSTPGAPSPGSSSNSTSTAQPPTRTHTRPTPPARSDAARANGGKDATTPRQAPHPTQSGPAPPSSPARSAAPYPTAESAESDPDPPPSANAANPSPS